MCLCILTVMEIQKETPQITKTVLECSLEKTKLKTTSNPKKLFDRPLTKPDP